MRELNICLNSLLKQNNALCLPFKYESVYRYIHIYTHVYTHMHSTAQVTGQ